MHLFQTLCQVFIYLFIVFEVYTCKQPSALTSCLFHRNSLVSPIHKIFSLMCGLCLIYSLSLCCPFQNQNFTWDFPALLLLQLSSSYSQLCTLSATCLRRRHLFSPFKTWFSGIHGWRSGLAPAFGPGCDPEDPGSNPTSGSWCTEPASPSASMSLPLSLSLSLCDYHK